MQIPVFFSENDNISAYSFLMAGVKTDIGRFVAKRENTGSCERRSGILSISCLSIKITLKQVNSSKFPAFAGTYMLLNAKFEPVSRISQRISLKLAKIGIKKSCNLQIFYVHSG